MLQISLRTLRRRMSEYCITQKMFQSTITELELDDKVREIVRYFPQIGYRRLLGELERQSIMITRSKARECLQRYLYNLSAGVTKRWLQGPVSRKNIASKDRYLYRILMGTMSLYGMFFILFLYFHIIQETYGDMMKKLHTICFFGCQQMEKTKEENHRKHILTNSLKTQAYRWKNLKPWWPTGKSVNHSSTVIFRSDSTSEWVSDI